MGGKSIFHEGGRVRALTLITYLLSLFWGFGVTLSKHRKPALSEPVFRLPLLGEQAPPVEVRLSGHSYPGQVLFFLNLTCPCARNARKMLQEQIPVLAGLGYTIRIINTDRTTPREGVKKLFQRLELGIPVLDDREWQLVEHFKIRTASEWVILKPSGEVLFSGTLYSEDIDYLVDITEDLSNGWPLRYARGPGLGCSLINPEMSDEHSVWIQ